MNAAILDELVQCALLDVIFTVHRKAKLSAAVCQVCGQWCRDYVSSPNLDVYGADPSLTHATEKISCGQCNASYGVSKFAKHLERCMGLEGARNGARVARKPGNGSSTPAYDNSPEKKRKKLIGKVSSVGTKPKRPKPSHTDDGKTLTDKTPDLIEMILANESINSRKQQSQEMEFIEIT